MTGTVIVAEQPTLQVVQVDQPTVQYVEGGKSSSVVAAGLRGPVGERGEQGPPGGTVVVATAGQTISALRAVYEDAYRIYYLDYRDAEHIDQLIGVSVTSGQSGDTILVQNIGIIDNLTWTFSVGRVWLGADGMLTQTPPTDGFDVLIGTAVSQTRLVLNLQDPIDTSE